MRHLPFLALAGLLLLSACNSNSYEPGAPAGWHDAPDRWWQEGVDTSVAFRDLESLSSMGVDEVPTFSAGGTVSRGAVAQSVKQSLIRLYRNQPEVIDSLFQAHVVPQIERAQLSNDTSEDVDRLRQEGYRAIGRAFQEPRTRLTLGEDIEVTYPDSLRERGVSGRVSMQVYLNEEGEPLAIKLVDPVHPVLDDIAMQATTDMRWRPAYRLQRGNWVAIPAWSRFNINFSTGQ